MRHGQVDVSKRHAHSRWPVEPAGEARDEPLQSPVTLSVGAHQIKVLLDVAAERAQRQGGIFTGALHVESLLRYTVREDVPVQPEHGGKVLWDMLDHDLFKELEDRRSAGFVHTNCPLRVCFHDRDALVESIKITPVHLDPVRLGDFFDAYILRSQREDRLKDNSRAYPW
jgi:hypothetical protein